MSTSEQTRHQKVAVERADTLFERRTIVEIQAIEKATEKQIQEKKTKLRGLVGDSYKDVIFSSDAIVLMTKQAESILTELSQMRELLGLKSTLSGDGILQKTMETETQLIGSRVKYLVDSQEVIWTALDSKEFLEASRRLLRALIVHELLQSNEIVFKQFPFLHHCWKMTMELRNPILERVQQEMINGGQKEVESCLCAIGTLEKLNSTSLLLQFLQFRKLRIFHLTTTHLSSVSSPTESLSEIGRLIQETFTQALGLFLVKEDGGGDCEIQVMAREDGIGFTGLLFGSEEEKSEESLWEQRLHLIYENLTPLSTSYLSSTLREWFQEVGKVVNESSQRLLSSCSSLKSLSQLEQEVKEDLKKDYGSWEEDVETKLESKFDIWTGIFEPILQAKCLALVEEAFTSSSQLLTKQLEFKIQSLSSMVMEPLGQVSTQSWNLGCGVNEEFRNKLSFLNEDLRWTTTSSSPRSQALELVKEFDERLNRLLEEILELLGKQDHHYHGGEDSPSKGSARHGGSVRSFSLVSGSRLRPSFNQRTTRSVDLEPKIQSLWEKTALGLSHHLHDLISNLPEIQQAEESLQLVEVGLLVGTTALGIAEQCASLSVLSGPTDEWRMEVAPPSTRSSIRWKQNDLNPSVWSLSNAFRLAAYHGIQYWSNWVTMSLAKRWRENIGQDKLTGSEHQEEIVVSHQIEVENQEEMRFWIPTAPSEQIIQSLRQASLELQRLGTFSIHSQILHLYQFQLEKEFRFQLQELISTLQKEENEDQKMDSYILQLLMDFRFVCDVCSAGEPVPAFQVDQSQDNTIRSLLSVPEDAISMPDQTLKQDPEVKKAILDSQKQSKFLEVGLSGFLDPIDWATYEPHLWTAEERFYRRTSVLFGSLIHTNKELHSQVEIKLPVGSENNTMMTAPVIARLPYLPVRSFVPDLNKNVRTSQGPGNKAIPMEAAELEEDPHGHFSFTDLTMTQPSASSRDVEATEKLQTGSFTSFGTMFTDKAAEMSALAQQRFEQFGDYLQPSSGGIFSTLAKGVSRTTQ